MIGVYEERALVTVAEAIVPGADQPGLLVEYERLLASFGGARAAGVRAAILFCALALPALLLGRARTLAGLLPQEREECLSRLLSHPLYLLQDQAARGSLGLPPIGPTPESAP
ncbi:MAG: hypothetical protein HY303_05715 [Candidatus Wallbacteria bacterium]|nr:hypothetical protein [Candidatus Wallbacteria bacterium]